jgi:hypothetical protein
LGNRATGFKKRRQTAGTQPRKVKKASSSMVVFLNVGGIREHLRPNLPQTREIRG